MRSGQGPERRERLVVRVGAAHGNHDRQGLLAQRPGVGCLVDRETLLTDHGVFESAPDLRAGRPVPGGVHGAVKQQVDVRQAVEDGAEADGDPAGPQAPEDGLVDPQGVEHDDVRPILPVDRGEIGLGSDDPVVDAPAGQQG
jgi:hypothetical protein